MGCNYYAQTKPCPTCGNCTTMKHIGKSSIGWKFLFRAYTMSPTSYKEWLEYLSNPDVIIIDEYGREITFNSFKDLIECKQKEDGYENRFYEAGGFYYDNEGYRFGEREFS